MNNPMQMMQMQMSQMLNQLQQNPAQFLSRKFNLPQNMNNPQDIVQHLLNSGQVTQQQVNQAVQMRKMFRR